MLFGEGLEVVVEVGLEATKEGVLELVGIAIVVLDETDGHRLRRRRGRRFRCRGLWLGRDSSWASATIGLKAVDGGTSAAASLRKRRSCRDRNDRLGIGKL